MNPIHILEAARIEITEATTWYGTQRVGLGSEFLAEFHRAASQIQAYPEAWARFSVRSRRYRLKRFPYGIVYQMREDRILVLAVMHLSRKPGYWKSRETPT